MIRDKEEHYIIIKGSIQEDTTITNAYTPNIEAFQYIRQMLTSVKGEVKSNPIVGNISTPLTSMARSIKQNIRRKHKL